MPRYVDVCKKTALILTALFLITAFPLQVLADDAAANPDTNSQGPNSPPGPDAKTYIFNSATGMWENAYYIWNPATGQTTPKSPQTYSYNPTTGRWDTTDWIYDPASGKYVPNTVSVAQPPAGAPTEGGPVSAAVTQPAESLTQGSSSPVSGSSSSTGLFDNFYNATISNSITAQALSGNAGVSHNTIGGDATSGDAMDIANIINVLQSTTDLQGNLATFSIDIPDNVQGDITIDPSQLPAAGQLKTNAVDSNVTINSQGTGQINNNIDLSARSGDATVSSNTTGGSATTGSAQTIANVMNIINSIIASGKSFAGTINIQGDFDGDILLPQSTLDSLLAANNSGAAATSGPNSPITSDTNNSFNASLTDNTGITNTIGLSAASGNASVTSNTLAGDAKTGNANTNITLLNLTGRQVVGKDALLVFVNVMGSWVGMIVNAPAGATSAALGGGVSTNGPSSSINDNQNNNTNLNLSTSNSINNNINLSSQSGNALVSNNTTAGNASSGNAMAGVNLLNITNSALSLSNWFGVLFINVFGSWNGSFGINTSAGNPAIAQNHSNSGGNSQNIGSSSVKAVKVFGFVPSGSSDSHFKVIQLAAATSPGSDNTTGGQGIPLTAVNTSPPAASQASDKSTSYFWIAGSLFLLAGIISGEEAVTRRKQTRQKLRSYLRSVTVAPLKKY